MSTGDFPEYFESSNLSRDTVGVFTITYYYYYYYY